MKSVIIFSAVILTSILVACGSGKKNESNEIKKTDSPKVEVRKTGELKIAYYNSDSLKKYFEYFKEQENIVTRKQKAFQKEVEKRSQEYQNFILRNQERMRKGMLSENESIQIQQKAQKMEAELMQYQQEQGSKLENETMKKLETISKKIEAYGKMFSEENGIDILLIHGPGGQINFINSAMDVTKEFTDYLNAHQSEIETDTTKK